MDQKLSEVSVSGAMAFDNAPQEEKVVQASTAWIVLLCGAVIGLIVSMLWLPAVADKVIGANIANTVLGTDAASVTLTDGWFGLAFAIAAGLANTFTACNCVVFSCIAPLSSQKQQTRLGVGRLLLWMALGVIIVTAIYGIFGAILNTQMPSLSDSTLNIGTGMPVRLLQSSIVFVILGLIFLYWGLSALQFVRNPLRNTMAAHPWLMPFALGLIVGFFTVGRPYPMFRELLDFTSGTGNFLLSAALIAVQGLCNIALMAIIFAILMYGTRGRFERWLVTHPVPARVLTAVSVIGGGVFLIAYWGIRLPSMFGVGWFPHL